MKGLGLEQKVTEAAIQKADEELIEKYCGGMYARGNGNGNNRYQRAGTVKRHPKTSVGKLDLKLHRVKDKGKSKGKKGVNVVLGVSNGEKVLRDTRVKVEAAGGRTPKTRLF